MSIQERIPAHLPQRSDSFRPSRGSSNRVTTFRSLNKRIKNISFEENQIILTE